MKSSEEVREAEYNVYTEIYKTKVFDFDLLEIVVNDYTGLHPTYIVMDKSRWSAPFIGKCKYLCARQPEILADFTCKNEEPYKLEKKFCVQKGYQFLSEKLLTSPLKQKSAFFTLSRVGFTSGSMLALVCISRFCIGSNVAYYLLFQCESLAWHLLGSNRVAQVS